jgi:hypothetical protein
VAVTGRIPCTYFIYIVLLVRLFPLRLEVIFQPDPFLFILVELVPKHKGGILAAKP